MELPASFKEFARQRAFVPLATEPAVPALVSRDRHSPFSYFLVALRAGVRYEERDEWGISHFLEHVLMRGTERYPTLYDLTRHVEGLGGQTAAYSTRDLTAYWVKVPSDSGPVALEVLEEILFHPSLDPKYIEAEREIIIHERQRESTNYSVYTANAIESLLLEPNPMSRHPVGEDEVLATFDAQRLRRYLERTYRRQNMVLVACGNLEDGLIERINSFLAQAPSGPPPKPANFLVESQYPDGSVIIKRSPFPQQVFISLGWRFPILSFKDLLTWRVINTLLGAGYTSLLNGQLRERSSLTYLCQTAMNAYDGMGIFKLHMAMHARDLPQAMLLVEEIIDSLAQGELAPEIFQEAVMRHAAGTVSRWENGLERVRLGGHLLAREGEIFDLQAYLEGLEGVSKERASQLVNRWLQPADRLVFICTGASEVEKMFPQTYII